LEFSNKYHEEQFPERYAAKHGESFSRRLNDRREQQLLRRCLKLTTRTASIADVGCGPGRFWGVLEQTRTERLIALDISQTMLSHARARNPAISHRFQLTAGSISALPFKDDAFDCVVAMRLLHHFGQTSARRQALAELARIASRFVVISLWTDGNFKAWRRRRLESRRGSRGYQNRHVVPRQQLEEDFNMTGLRPIGHFDLLPGYSQWRYYVLQPAVVTGAKDDQTRNRAA
jgi:SAM-dependent methyltransferase